MRTMIFARRNLKEVLRDPVSYIFCLGFPVVMLVLMSVINSNIPNEAGVKLFEIENLSCGVAVFSLTFTTLCAAMLVSKDRTGAFMQRMFISPMRAVDFLLGYALPLVSVAVIQVLITFVVAVAISFIIGGSLAFWGVLLSIAVLLPSAVFFVFAGVALGFLLSDKSAPPVCSIMVTAGGLLGGIWLDPHAAGEWFVAICRVLPFYNAVEAARSAVSRDLGGILLPLGIIIAYVAAALAASVITIRVKKKS